MHTLTSRRDTAARNPRPSGPRRVLRAPLHSRPGAVVAAAAAAAALLRLATLVAPIGADEAGFTLVARAWDADPGSLFGDYWVARPPVVIALVRLTDLLGGPALLRVVGALACAASVVAASGTARLVLRHAGVTDSGRVRRGGAWVAVLVAALTTSALIDPASTKGELLGIPLVLTSLWLVLLAVARVREGSRPAAHLAALSGVAAALATGMKQNLVTGVIFGLVVLVGSRVAGHLDSRSAARLLAAGIVGTLVPVAAVIGWALGTGVDLGRLWFALYGFRSETLQVLAADTTGGSPGRGLVLLGLGAATGLLLVLAGLAVHHRRVRRTDPVLLVAVTSTLALDVIGLVLGGQYWRPYLFSLIPGVVVATALLLAGGTDPARRTRLLVVAAAACSLVSSVVWTSAVWQGQRPSDEVSSGTAVAQAARPGDTIISYGGAPDLVLSSGLRSPYPYLWSLQMRTRDPGLARLRSVLAGPDAPTWVVMLAPSGSWKRLDAAIRPTLEARYDVHGRVCNGRYVWLRTSATRPPLTPDCAPA